MTAAGEPWFVGGTRTTVGGTTSNRGLFRGPAGTKVVIGGDFVAGIADAVSAASGPQFTYRVSADGSNWISEIVFTGAAANSDAVVINNAVALSSGAPVREGFAVPAASGGVGGELWQNFGKLGIADDGTWMMTGDTSAAANDDFLAINGQFILRQGMVVDGFTLGGTIEAAYLNNDGDWVVNWTVDVGGTFREALILNGTDVLLKETDPIDYDGDGLPDAGVTLVDFTGIDNLSLSDRRPDGTVDVYFTADTSLATNNEAAYRMTVSLGAPCPLDLSGNGIVDADDIFAFLTIWFAGPPGGACSGCAADWDGDGLITADDIFAFLNDWFAFGPGNACP